MPSHSVPVEAEILTLFETYAAGFDDFDAEAIADCFAYPCTIWQFGRGNVFVDRDDLKENIEALLDVFDKEEIVQSSFTLHGFEEANGTGFARLSWRQDREGGEPALAFSCVYALLLGPDGWHIATVFNDDPEDIGPEDTGPTDMGSGDDGTP